MQYLAQGDGAKYLERRGDYMKYEFKKLSVKEKKLLETIFLDEVETQRWFAINYSTSLAAEVVVALQ